MPIITYCLPLFIGQTQAILQRLKTCIMTLYRYMYSLNTHMVRSEYISNNLGLPTPHQLLAQQTVTFVHRFINRQTPPQLYNLIEFPARSERTNAPRLVDPPTSRRGERTLLFEGVRIYANIPKSVRELPEKLFNNHIKCHNIDISKNPT